MSIYIITANGTMQDVSAQERHVCRETAGLQGTGPIQLFFALSKEKLQKKRHSGGEDSVFSPSRDPPSLKRPRKACGPPLDVPKGDCGLPLPVAETGDFSAPQPRRSHFSCFHSFISAASSFLHQPSKRATSLKKEKPLQASPSCSLISFYASLTLTESVALGFSLLLPLRKTGIFTVPPLKPSAGRKGSMGESRYSGMI